MKKIYIAFLFITGLILLSGCEDWLRENPKDFNQPKDYYKNNNNMLTGINGVYATLKPANYYGMNFPFAAEAFAETGITTNGTAFNALTNPRGTNGLFPSTDITTRIWNALYYSVNQANTFINRANEATGDIDPALRSRVIGEACFLRALTYFNLVKCWGAIPLRKERSVDFTSPNIAASSVPEVFASIIEDLEFAEKNCWDKGEVRSTFTNDVGRVTVLAAQSLLAKVYLEIASSTNYATETRNTEYYHTFEHPSEYYYNKALDYCTIAIDNKDFGWVGNWADIWSLTNQNSSEMIFAVQFAPQVSHGSSFFESFTPKASLYNKTSLNKGAFGIANPFLIRYTAAPWKINDADYRFKSGMMLSFAVKERPSISITWDGIGLKYNNPDKTSSKPWGSSANDSPGVLRMAKWIDSSVSLDNASGLDWPVIRAAELYLMRAEIKAELSPNDVSVAFADFNKVRARGNSTLLDTNELASYGSANKPLGTTELDYFHDVILRERLIEFMLEGHRWFDLKRLGLLEAVTKRMEGTNKNALNRIRDKATDYYWPYPQDELEGNTSLSQKTGY